MKWSKHDWQTMLQSGQWVAPQDREKLRELLSHRPVCLASASPRRQEILTLCGVRHHVASHSIAEPPPHGPDWRGWVRTWAMRKAIDAVGNLRAGLVISADTIVVLGRNGLGKPQDSQNAQSMLRMLSGRTHQVYTGVAVIDVASARKAAGSAVSHVHFRRLSGNGIALYVRSREPLDKAGAYAIQGGGGKFVDRINGPLDNIIGLPVGCLITVLQRVMS